MVDPVTIIQGAVTALKGAGDIAQGLSKLNTMAEVQAKAIELQQIILSAQSYALTAQAEHFSLLEKIRQLEKELTDIKAWESEKQRYELKELKSGVFAYALKEQTNPSEPAHNICASCYEHGKKSVLQSISMAVGRTVYLVCHGCNSQILFQGLVQTEHGKIGKR